MCKDISRKQFSLECVRWVVASLASASCIGLNAVADRVSEILLWSWAWPAWHSHMYSTKD